MADSAPAPILVACSTYPFQSLPLDQALVRMDELGFRYADLSISQVAGAGHMTPAQVREEPVAALEIIESAMDRSHVRIVVLDLETKPFDLTERGQVEAVCRLARRAGAGVVNVMRAGGKDDAVDLRRLRDFAHVARDFDLMLTVEPRGRLTMSPQEAAEAAADAGFRITLDVGRMLSGGIPQEAWAPLYPVLGHVHLYDTKGEDGRRQVPWGTGNVQVGSLMTALRAARYRGFVTAEYLSPTPGDPAPFDPEPELVKLRRAVEAELAVP
ncbi:MAG: sugar phosphate isomerase/epimerase [Candidatus Coatesbacteria bacterium]